MTGESRRQPKIKKTVAAAGTVGRSVCYIDRLPNEVLSEIFLFYGYTITAAKFEELDDNSRSRINTDATRIACVNRHWNAIALAIPTLWSKIYVSVRSFSHGRFLNFFVGRRLKLSKDAPLDICVLFSKYIVTDRYFNRDRDGDSDKNSETPQGTALPVLENLFQHAHRWRSAVLQLPVSQELENTKFPDMFPLLQELEMRCVLSLDSGADPCSAAFYAPLLRKVRIEQFSFGGSFGSSHLNEITLTWVTADTVVGFLEHVSSECNAKVFAMLISDTNYSTTATASPLKALSVVQTEDDSEYDDTHWDLFIHLTLPNVEKLVFIDERIYRADYAEWSDLLFPVEGLLSMFARSEASLMKLSHLEFGGHYISDQNLLKILTKLPALAFFGFKETSLLDEESRALTTHFFQGVMSADVMPRLTQLELIFYDSAVPVDDLVSFLESRRPSPEGDKSSMRLLPLKEAQIGISSPQTCAALMDRLSGLCSGGLIVKVSKPWF